MKTRRFKNIEVSAIGLGCMGFTHAYGEGPEEEEGIRLVHYAFDKGCRIFDTAEMYSTFKNEEFVGKAIRELPRDRIVISDKFWPQPLGGQEFPEGKLSEAGIRKDLEGSLERLGTDYIDLYLEHVIDDASIEDVAETMGKLIREGKIRGWGLSSPTLEQLKRADAVTPVTVIQSEFSMMERKWQKEVLPYCSEHGIGFEAFAPMGNGFLSGKYTASSTFAETDLRTKISRFDPENMKANQPLLDLIAQVAAEKGCTSGQIALAWILASGDTLVPIPGMRKEKRIDENLGAAEVELTAEEYRKLNKALDNIEIHGDRAGKDIAKLDAVPNSAIPEN